MTFTSCKVVVPTAAHEPAVLEFLDAAFQRVELALRNSTNKYPDVFRFDSTRWRGRVQPLSGLLGPPGLEALMFEVQIQTVFEHAWTVVTHDLVYKADAIDWRRLRLAALLKAATEQLDLVVAGFEASLDFVPRSPDPAD